MLAYAATVSFAGPNPIGFRERYRRSAKAAFRGLPPDVPMRAATAWAAVHLIGPVDDVVATSGDVEAEVLLFLLIDSDFSHGSAPARATTIPKRTICESTAVDLKNDYPLVLRKRIRASGHQRRRLVPDTAQDLTDGQVERGSNLPRRSFAAATFRR